MYYYLYFHRRMCYISIYLFFFFTLDMHLSFYLLHHLLCIVVAYHFDGWMIILPIKYIFKCINVYSGDRNFSIAFI